MEFLIQLVEHPALFITLLGILITFISLIVFIIHKYLSQGGKIETKWFKLSSEHKKKKKVSGIPLIDTLIEEAVTNGTLNLQRIFDTTYRDLLKIKEDYLEEKRKAQQSAFERTRSILTLSYSDSSKENMELLELYLTNILNNILIEKLEDIKQSNESGIYSQEEIISKIPFYTSEIFTSCKLAFKKSNISKPESLISLLNNQEVSIKDIIGETIKQFVVLTEKEQQEQIVIISKQKEQIKSELERIIGVHLE